LTKSVKKHTASTETQFETIVCITFTVCGIKQCGLGCSDYCCDITQNVRRN